MDLASLPALWTMIYCMTNQLDDLYQIPMYYWQPLVSCLLLSLLQFSRIWDQCWLQNALSLVDLCCWYNFFTKASSWPSDARKNGNVASCPALILWQLADIRVFCVHRLRGWSYLLSRGTTYAVVPFPVTLYSYKPVQIQIPFPITHYSIPHHHTTIRKA